MRPAERVRTRPAGRGWNARRRAHALAARLPRPTGVRLPDVPLAAGRALLFLVFVVSPVLNPAVYQAGDERL